MRDGDKIGVIKTLPKRQRVAILLAVMGVGLMGVDLLITRDVFVHVGELMVLSLLCLAGALVIDRKPGGKTDQYADRDNAADR